MGSIEPVDDPSEDYATIMAPTLIGNDFSSLVSSWVPSRRFGKTWTRWRYAASMTIDGVEYAPGFSTDFPSDPFETSEWPANYRAHVGNPLWAMTFVMLGSLVQTIFFVSPAMVHVNIIGISQAEARFV